MILFSSPAQAGAQIFFFDWTPAFAGEQEG